MSDLAAFGPAPAPAAAFAQRRPSLRWYRHRPAEVVDVDCSGGTHRVRWHRGALVLLDHDVASEVALTALGGDRPACLDVLDAWREACTGPRSVDRVDLALPLRRAATLARLVHTERRWADPALPDGDRRVALDRLVTRFRDAVAASLAPSRRQRGMQRIEVSVVPVPSGNRMGVEAVTAPDRIKLRVELPVSWVVQVAGRGVSRVGDHVVLDVVDRDDAPGSSGLLGVVAVRWDVPRPRLVVPTLTRLWVEPVPLAPDGTGSATTEIGWDIVAGRRPVRVREEPWWSVSVR